jgi:hypothetical protein
VSLGLGRLATLFCCGLGCLLLVSAAALVLVLLRRDRRNSASG